MKKYFIYRKSKINRSYFRLYRIVESLPMVYKYTKSIIYEYRVYLGEEIIWKK